MGKKTPDQIGATRRAKTRFADRVSDPEYSFRKRARLRHLRPDRLRASKYQPELRHADAGIQELADSIAETGLLQFPGARELEDGTIEILFGHRRTRAFALAIFAGKVESKTMPVYVAKGISDSEALRLLVTENFQRTAADADYLHEAEMTGRIVQDMKRELGRRPSIREVSRIMPCSRDTVHANMRIAGALADPMTGPLVRASRHLPKGLVRRILSHEDPEAQVEALELAASGHSASSVREVLGRDTSDCGHNGSRNADSVVRRTKKTSGGRYTVHVDVDPAMPADQLDQAVSELERTLQELRSIRDARVSDV